MILIYCIFLVVFASVASGAAYMAVEAFRAQDTPFVWLFGSQLVVALAFCAFVIAGIVTL